MNTTTPATKSTRGRKPLAFSFPTGAFSVKQLAAKNPTAKCELTVRNHIARGLASGKLVKLAKKLEKGTVGAPQHLFQLATYARKNAGRRAPVTAPASA
jgi:hypothetical protein